MKLTRMMRVLTLSLIPITLLVSAASGAENPLFKHWATFHVGSSVTLEGRYEAGFSDDAKKGTYWQKLTLIENGDDYVILKSTVRWDSAPAETSTYRLYRQVKGKLEDLGYDYVTVKGVTMRCHGYRISDSDGWQQFWVHPDIPGPTKTDDAVFFSATKTTAVNWETM